MAEWYLIVAAFLLLNLVAGLFMIYRARSPLERLLTLQLFGTTTIAVVLLLSQSQGDSALRDVALLLALLASLTSIAFVRLPPRDHTVEAADR